MDLILLHLDMSPARVGAKELYNYAGPERGEPVNGKKLIKLFPSPSAQNSTMNWSNLHLPLNMLLKGEKTFLIAGQNEHFAGTLSHSHQKNFEGKICNQDIIKSRHHHNKSVSLTQKFHAQKYCWWEIFQGKANFTLQQ